MNSPTANSSDTPSRTLMEDLRVTAYCRVCSDCREGGCKGTRARRGVGHKESVKSGFMRALRRSFVVFGLAPSRAGSLPQGQRISKCGSEPAREDGITDNIAPNWRTKSSYPHPNIPDTTALNLLRLVSRRWHAHCTRPPRSFPILQGASA